MGAFHAQQQAVLLTVPKKTRTHIGVAGNANDGSEAHLPTEKVEDGE